MTQKSIQVSTTPPLPGLTLVGQLNDALNTIATQFSGANDPAQFAVAFSLWADTTNNVLKRRNSANTAWVIVADLLNKSLTSADIKTLSPSLKWSFAPIGQAIPLNSIDLPPTNDASCVWVELSATSSYGSNSTNLKSISTTGTAPDIISTAVVNNANSPLNNKTIALINDDGRYIIAGNNEGSKRNDAIQNMVGYFSGQIADIPIASGIFSGSSVDGDASLGGSYNGKRTTIKFDNSIVARTDDTTHGRDISARFFMRIV